ncbi:MAG: leucyl aminopeptidase [Burkholderiaceae bacterium]|jgi:leucyl aminopeptidase
MNFELATMNLDRAAADRTDILVVLVPEAFAPDDDALSQLISDGIKAGELDTKAGKLLQAWRIPGVKAARVLLVGAGDGSVRQVRSAVASAMAVVKAASVKRMTLCFPWECTGDVVRAVILTVADATYVYTTTKSRPEGRMLHQVLFGLPDATAVSSAFGLAVAAVGGIEFAREWANRPANHATPALLAEAARALAKGPKFQCEVLGPKQVLKLGMGAFLAVAQGSLEPLRFIVLKYNGTAKASPPVVLVGKGITFDTGGISIKPAPEMDEMKFDMSGAASVLGVFRALADIKPDINVIGLIPACENMPDGRAVKPGDVVTSLSGQTIEILNTDAEGRLVLCDALTYAERFKPRAVVDIATLTGACMIALGAVRSGLFATSDGLAQALLAAGESSQDLCWRMPLDDDYAEGLKTNFADVANVAGKAGGAVTAAKFLQRFAMAFDWAHLDIAGTAWKGGATKGATGRPVGLLLDYLVSVATSTSLVAARSRKVAGRGSLAASRRTAGRGR